MDLEPGAALCASVERLILRLNRATGEICDISEKEVGIDNSGTVGTEICACSIVYEADCEAVECCSSTLRVAVDN